MTQDSKAPLLWFLLTLVVITLFTLFAPLERTLGINARFVYLHGAWVWSAMIAILSAGVMGLIGLITRRPSLHAWSRSLGRTGLLLWVIFLPMSMYVMQANWNGLFLDEPRFRIPLNYAIVGLLLQVGLSFFPSGFWPSLANIIFGAAFLYGMNGLQTVLHPESPIFKSNARSIQLFFV